MSPNSKALRKSLNKRSDGNILSKYGDEEFKQPNNPFQRNGNNTEL
jgi:hypothetical protein